MSALRRRQVPERLVSLSSIMRSAVFRRGVAEVRAGRPPRFDDEDSWEYERGRQWAIAMPSMCTMGVKSHDSAQAEQRRAVIGRDCRRPPQGRIE